MMLAVRDMVYFKISTWLFLRFLMNSMNRHGKKSVLSQQQGGVIKEKNYSSKFSTLQEASTALQCFVRLQVLWLHKSENASKQMEDTSNNLLEC